ncbi:MAP7 domain-containing protein 2-like isoform X1 [Solea senegalensis]|uniref:MAP7 domain-containing protein 2-like isoform X1 n=1 Tax=Solea senegalensis TaxID=28829 RepID=A0AAV6SD41_SOLSE|nr:MAP7 domain-containing protein 2a isoform X1 [Solea senegalensis]KAG7515249.1 MAP7 domain-containing protein 2-like isoform X1 [Solea senegalensis]
MAKTVSPSSALAGEKMAPPSITLLPEKNSPTNGHCSPARTGKTTPSNTEKKPHINGHASPSHLAANHAGKQIVEGYMKTDDRMRLAKERREERERSLAARDQLIREKERRARLQYERTVEERWRRLEEQRQKEELRRAAVEEKRRQQLEEERERLEALMKRSLERNLLLEQRSKRWNKGCPTGAGDSENAPLPFSAASAFSHGIASPLPAGSESAPCSPHRSPFCSSLNPVDHSRAGLQGGSQSTPNTPKKERLRRERRTASPGYASPVRRSESPASVTKHLASPSTSKLTSKMRGQSATNNCSPTRHRPNTSTGDKNAEKHGEQLTAEPALKNNTNMNSTNPPSQSLSGEMAKISSSKDEAPDKHQSPDRKDHVSLKVDSSEKKDGDKKRDSAPCAGKMAAGTTSAEEATRLLAERRRQARAQKELEDQKRQQEEEERLKKEQRQKQLAHDQLQQEVKNQQVKEKVEHEEDLCRPKEHEDKHKKEEEENERHMQMNQEREKAKVQAQEDAERQRQDRELQAQQEEEKRQLRKKRIEEIMKRTRKGEADMKKEDEVETKSVSPPEGVKAEQNNAQANEQTAKKVAFQVKEAVAKVQVNIEKETIVATAQTDNQKSEQVKNSTHQVMAAPGVPDKRPGTKASTEELASQHSQESNTRAVKHQGREVEINLNKQHAEHVKATNQINEEPTWLRADARDYPTQGGTMNGAAKGKRSGRPTAEGSKRQSLHVSLVERNDKGGSRVEVVRHSMTPLPVGHLSAPIIRQQPLDVKGTCDEVQAMEISPASKEELISIQEFSPVNELQHGGLSNTRALEDLMDLTGSVSHLKPSSEGNIGDCNENLIEGVVSPMSDSKHIGISPSSSNKLSIQ